MGRRLPKAAGWHWTRAEPILDENGKRTCRWCCGKITAKRLTSYCSDKCRFEFTRRCSWPITRQYIFGLQKGICKKCGIDLRMIDPDHCNTQLQYAMKIEAGDDRWRKWHPPVFLVDGHPLPSGWWRRQREIAEEWARDNKCLGRSVFEIDHEPPLAMGGDWFAIHGLQALCRRCHVTKSREDSARIAAYRKSLGSPHEDGSRLKKEKE